MNKPISDTLFRELLSSVKTQIKNRDPREMIPAFQKLIQMKFSAEDAYRILVTFLLDAMKACLADDSVEPMRMYRNDLRRIANGNYSVQELKERLEESFMDPEAEDWDDEPVGRFLTYYLTSDSDGSSPDEGASRYLALSEEDRFLAVQTLSELAGPEEEDEGEYELEQAWDVIDCLRDDLQFTEHFQELAEFSRMVLEEFGGKELLDQDDRADLLFSEGDALMRAGRKKEAEGILVRVPFAEDGLDLMTVLIDDLSSINTEKTRRRAEKLLNRIITEQSDVLEEEPDLAESLRASAEKLDVPEETLALLEDAAEHEPGDADDFGLTDTMGRSLVNHMVLTLKDSIFGELEDHPVPGTEKVLKNFQDRGFSEEQSKLLVCLGFLSLEQQNARWDHSLEKMNPFSDLPAAIDELMNYDDAELRQLLEQMDFSGLSELAMTMEHLLIQRKDQEAIAYYEAHQEEFFQELEDYIREEQMDYEELCEQLQRKGVFFDEVIFGLLDAFSQENRESEGMEFLKRFEQIAEINDPEDQDRLMRAKILLNDELDQAEKADQLLEEWKKNRMNCLVQQTILDLLMRRNQKMDAKRTADQFMKDPIPEDDQYAGDLLKTIRAAYLAADNKKSAREAEKKYKEMGFDEEELDDSEFRFYH